MDNKLIFENWRTFIINESLPPPPGTENIETIGELVEYFKNAEPSVMKKAFAKYGKAGAKILGTAGAALATTGFGAGAGAAAGVAAVAGGALAQKLVEDILTAGALMFANVEDGTYQEGSAISFFDLDDKVQAFLRDTEHGVKDAVKGKISRMEKEAIDKMILHVRKKAKEFSPDTKLQDALGITAQDIMDKQFRDENDIRIQTGGR